MKEKLVEKVLDLLALNWLDAVVLSADFSAKTHVFYPDRISIQGLMFAISVNASFTEMAPS